MSRHGLNPLGALSRLWSHMLTVSEVAVANHYRQPWQAESASSVSNTVSRKQSAMSFAEHGKLSSRAFVPAE